MLYVFYGPDDYSRELAIRQLQNSLGDRELASLNSLRLDGADLAIKELEAAVNTLPFLTERRLVVVSGLLARFNPRRVPPPKDSGPRASRGTAPRELENPTAREVLRRNDAQQASSMKSEEWQAWASLLSRVPDSTWLVLTDNEVDQQNPLLRALPKDAHVRVFERPRGDLLHAWIVEQVRMRGGSITHSAVEALASITDDLRILSNEIDKLLLYVGKGRITEQHVRELVGYAREFDVFDLVDAVLQRRTALSMKLLHQLLQRGQAPPYVLFMLARQLRMVLLTASLREQGASEQEMRQALGQPSEFVLRKLLMQARDFSIPQIEAAYFRMLEADVESKTGRKDPALALELLLLDLCGETEAGGPK